VWARTVEHLFGALAGLGAHRGIEVELDADELPLLDGGASAWCEAIASLGPVDSGPPRLEVKRPGRVQVLASDFEFTPGPAVPEVLVELVTSDPRLTPRASWDGTVATFLERIAPSRTFALAHEVAAFADRDLAKFVDPRSVLVLGDEILWAGTPFRADEPASHKLLDLLGDMVCYGGPPRGRVYARRAGHAANHAAMSQALAQGILGFADA
jgi:UDP-3-O-[3-hydroxymyristoyl] N-acetylglucosamine deacetylase